MVLKAEERFMVIEGLLKSLDEPDWRIDEIRVEGAEIRFKAFSKGG